MLLFYFAAEYSQVMGLLHTIVYDKYNLYKRCDNVQLCMTHTKKNFEVIISGSE